MKSIGTIRWLSLCLIGLPGCAVAYIDEPLDEKGESTEEGAGGSEAPNSEGNQGSSGSDGAGGSQVVQGSGGMTGSVGGVMAAGSGGRLGRRRLGRRKRWGLYQ